MKLYVLSAMQFIAEVWRVITLTTIKSCFAKCGFPVDHVYSNNDKALKLTEDEENSIVCSLLAG
jgi:hypothetical protein